MQSVILGKAPWQRCALLSIHMCPLLKSAVPVKSSQLPRTQVLIMLDCSPAPLDSNRVTNTIANLSSLGEQGFQLTGPIQQLLLSCYFQSSTCCRWSRRRALCCPLLPKEVISQDRRLPRSTGKEEWFSVVHIWFPLLFHTEHST